MLASEAKALFRLGVEPRWDEQSFWQVAGMQYPLADRTLFRGIRQLPPGGLLLADANNAIGRVSRYWEMNYPRESGRTPFVPRVAADALRSPLEEAVRLRLCADVPICFHLSGGLDSSSVVALAQRTLSRLAACFTVGFDGAGYDERCEHGERPTPWGAMAPCGAAAARPSRTPLGRRVFQRRTRHQPPPYGKVFARTCSAPCRIRCGALGGRFGRNPGGV